MISHRLAFPVTCVLLALSAAVQAQEAGSVTFATGDVTAARQPPVNLAKGDTVVVSDVIVTAAAARAQLLMIDGAKIAIRPSSRLVLAEYAYAQPAPAAAGAVVTSDDDSSVIELVKGGLRTITGAIGDENPEGYEVRTAVGVLGIRGTDFAVLLCSGDCAFAPGVAAGAAVPDGLYIMVTDGIVVFGNEVAEIVITAGQFVYIPFDTREPERLDARPPVFIDDSDLEFIGDAGIAGQADTDTGAPAGFDAALGTRRSPEPGSAAPTPDTADQDGDDARRDTPAQSIQGIDADGRQIDLTPGGVPDPQNRSITWSSGPLDQTGQFSATLVNVPGQYQVDTSNNLTGFFNEYPAFRTGGGNASFDVGTAANVDTGFDTQTVLRWGRWSGGQASIILADGTDVSQDLGARSLHWVSSPEYASAPVLPMAGIAEYTLVGATAPTDNAGNTGVLGNATFVADFLNMIVTSTLDIQINGSTWQAAGSGGIGANADPVVPAHLFNGSYDAVVIDGQTGGFGTFSGFFSEPGPSSDPSFPGGAGLTYSVQDAQGATTVSGAAAFGNP